MFPSYLEQVKTGSQLFRALQTQLQLFGERKVWIPAVTELTARCADLAGIGRTGVCRNYLRWREQSQYKLHFLYTLTTHNLTRQT